MRRRMDWLLSRGRLRFRRHDRMLLPLLLWLLVVWRNFCRGWNCQWDGWRRLDGCELLHEERNLPEVLPSSVVRGRSEESWIPLLSVSMTFCGFQRLQTGVLVSCCGVTTHGTNLWMLEGRERACWVSSQSMNGLCTEETTEEEAQEHERSLGGHPPMQQSRPAHSHSLSLTHSPSRGVERWEERRGSRERVGRFRASSRPNLVRPKLSFPVLL